MEIKVIAKYIPISPKKVRKLSNHLSGRRVEDILAYLIFETQSASLPVMKLIKSGVAAAEEKKLDKESLIIKEIRVDGGLTRRKQRIRARGRADLQRKRTSHITLILEEKKVKKTVKPSKKIIPPVNKKK